MNNVFTFKLLYEDHTKDIFIRSVYYDDCPHTAIYWDEDEQSIHIEGLNLHSAKHVDGIIILEGVLSGMGPDASVTYLFVPTIERLIEVNCTIHDYTATDSPIPYVPNVTYSQAIEIYNNIKGDPNE